MRILISAYACEPEKGSEPGVGWNWVRQISRFHETWVVTRANNREPIEHALAIEPLPNAHFVYFDLPRGMRFWKKGERGIHLYYYLWQLGAYLAAKNLHRNISFDLVHHVTFVNYWMPSFVALLPVPFIWGPVGGGESAPRVFWRSFSLRGKMYETLRDLARSVGEFDPFVRLTARRAALAFATTQETEDRLRRLGCQKVSVLSGCGLSNDEIMRLSDLPVRQGNTFRLISLGRLLHLKGFELGMRAFARFYRQFQTTELWIVGAGPERKRLEGIARKLHVESKVRFLGEVPRSKALEALASCDVLVHPSLHDSGGWVCTEAMAAGRPVICLDMGGPALQVTENTGIKVPVLSPEQVIRDLACAYFKLATDPELCARLSLGARKRVEADFSWDKKGIFMMKIYESLCTVQGRTARDLKF